MANQATRSRRNSVLEPMNPYERRIIHTTIQGIPGVTSWSIGEEPNRRVVIGLADDNGERRSSRDRGNRGGRPRAGTAVTAIAGTTALRPPLPTPIVRQKGIWMTPLSYGQIDPK